MPNRSTKKRIVVFRLSDDDAAELDKRFRHRPIVGITSSDQLARKVIQDFLRNRIFYLSPDAARGNPEIR